jgi:hypothetical protein
MPSRPSAPLSCSACASPFPATHPAAAGTLKHAVGTCQYSAGTSGAACVQPVYLLRYSRISIGVAKRSSSSSSPSAVSLLSQNRSQSQPIQRSDSDIRSRRWYIAWNERMSVSPVLLGVVVTPPTEMGTLGTSVGVSATICDQRIVIGSRWVSTPPAVAGKLRPRRLNHYPLYAPSSAVASQAKASPRCTPRPSRRRSWWRSRPEPRRLARRRRHPRRRS